MRLIIMLLAAGLAAPAVAQDASRPAAFTNAEACLRSHVVDAVGASSGAADAADFLLTYLCASSVSSAGNYERNTASLAAMKTMFAGAAAVDIVQPLEPEAATTETQVAENEGDFGLSDMADLYKDVSVDPVTGDIVAPAGGGGSTVEIFLMQAAAVKQMPGAEQPIFLRELAGRLVLQHRR